MPSLAAFQPAVMADVVDLSCSSPTEPDSPPRLTSAEADSKNLLHDTVAPAFKEGVGAREFGDGGAYEEQLWLAPLYGAIRYAERQNKKLPNAQDFATPSGVSTSKEMQDDLQSFGFGKVQARQMLARRETETDGHMQRMLRREGSSLSQSGLPTAQPERRGRVGKAAVSSIKYEPLRLSNKENNWVLFDPSKADQQLIRSLPPLLKTFARYAPGNARVLEYNVISENVRIRCTPKHILDKSIEFTPQGPKVVNIITARRKAGRTTDAQKQTNKRSDYEDNQSAESRAETSLERVNESMVPESIEASQGRRGRPKITTGRASLQNISIYQTQMSVASVAGSNETGQFVLKGQGKSRVKQPRDQVSPVTEAIDADNDMAKTKRRKTKHLSQARRNGKLPKSELIVVDSSASESTESDEEKSTEQWEEVGSDKKRVKKEEEDYVIQDSQE